MALLQREEALDDTWTLGVVENFVKGENTDISKDQLEEGESPDALNVRYDLRQVIADTGYAQFADTGIWGSPRRAFEFEKTDGTIQLLLLTNSSLFLYSSTLSQWFPLKGDATHGSTTLSANEASGQTTYQLFPRTHSDQLVLGGI